MTNHKDEIAKQEQIYDAFFDATDLQEIERLAPLLNPFYYHAEMDKEGYYVSQEKITPLEIAAEDGKIDHLNALLSLNIPKRLSRGVLKNSSIHHPECAALFRALDNGHVHIVSRLLERPAVSAGILDVTIKRPKHTLEDKDYIDSIRSPKHYPIQYSQILPQGNVALVMAARLPQSDLFNTLLEIDVLNRQLKESALVSFFSATMQMNGVTKPKSEINQEIVNKLLDIPSVYEYVRTREFDFGELIEAYHDSKKESFKRFKGQFFRARSDLDLSVAETDVELNTLSSSGLESGSVSQDDIPSEESTPRSPTV